MDAIDEAMQTLEGRAVARREIKNLMKPFPLGQSLAVLIGAAIDLSVEKGRSREQTIQIIERVMKEME